MSLKIGSKVEVEIGQVEDWVFLRDGKPVGALTAAVLEEIEREKRKTK
jgi:uncharacterized protein YegJ (DUF2314 family)